MSQQITIHVNKRTEDGEWVDLWKTFESFDDAQDWLAKQAIANEWKRKEI